MKLFDLGLDEIAAVLGVLGALFGAVLWLIRAGSQIKTDFASRSELDEIDARLTEVEGKIGNIPTHADLQRVAERVGGVEQQIGALLAQLRSLSDMVTLHANHASQQMQRVERQVGILLQHELDKERRGTPE
jgi:hypothetical protein